MRHPGQCPAADRQNVSNSFISDIFRHAAAAVVCIPVHEFSASLEGASLSFDMAHMRPAAAPVSDAAEPEDTEPELSPTGAQRVLRCRRRGEGEARKHRRRSGHAHPHKHSVPHEDRISLTNDFSTFSTSDCMITRLEGERGERGGPYCVESAWPRMGEGER